MSCVLHQPCYSYEKVQNDTVSIIKSRWEVNDFTIAHFISENSDMIILNLCAQLRRNRNLLHQRICLLKFHVRNC
jgi:hypothetical protein